MNASEIISVLKSEIADFDRKTGVQEGGTVVRVGDGIATVYGMQHAMYGELVEFETGVRGIIQNLEEKTVGVVLLGSDYGIVEGTQVMRTKKRAGVGVGSGLIGRVVDALGAPIDGGAPIEPEDYYPIEREAAGVADRKSVSVPLQTGILSIDSMFPIGRGQRELIIGDRQTGKTSIAVDTIINQKGQDVICIYVAIGQKSSTVAKIVNTLKTHGAMDYSVVVSASASAPAPVQYIAPYSGTAMAEFFMHQGKDVLIVYDDLSKHTVQCPCCSIVRRGVKLIRVTFSICTPVCWSVPADWTMHTAAVQSPHCQSSKHRQAIFPLTFRRMSSPSQMVRSSWKANCSSLVCVRQSMSACPFLVSAVLLRPRQ